MRVPRMNFAAIKLKNGCVFISGGQTTGGKVTNECEITGGTLADMLIKRMAHSTVQVGDYVYAFGGMDENSQMIASVERVKLTDSQSKWEYVCDMPIACCNVGLMSTSQG